VKRKLVLTRFGLTRFGLTRFGLTRLGLTWLGLTAISTAPADTIDTTGQEPWERCGYCHGIDGISMSPRFPHLAGQRADYLAKQLLDFGSGRRTNDEGAMRAQAEILADDEREQIVAYFSAQPGPEPQAELRSESAERLLMTGDSARAIPACVSCHGTKAAGNGQAPALASQQADYLRKQLDDFANGKRANDALNVMPAIAKALSVQERASLSSYLAGIPRTAVQEARQP